MAHSWEVPQPSWLTGGMLGRFASSSAQSWWDRDAQDAAAMELVWGSVSAAAAHGSVSGIAMITKPWHVCDTFTEVSDHCCTTEGWFAAALNHQGRGSHWQRAVQEGCAEAGVGENGKGSCLLEGIRCSSECGEGITGSPTCQAVLIGRTEEEYELNNCPAINF